VAGVSRVLAEESYPPDGRSIRRARVLVAAACRDAEVDADVIDTAVLLTSEAVTNAVLHGRSIVRVRVEVTSGRVHVGVSDDNSRHPRLQPQDAGALDGRGMQILQLVATRWGVDRQDLGKVVWFELDVG